MRAATWVPLWLKSVVRDKVIQWGAVTWGFLWLKSIVQDKVLQQGAVTWGPLWSKSVVWEMSSDKGQLLETHCGWSLLYEKSPPTRGSYLRPFAVNTLDIQPPQTMNSMFCCKDESMVFPALSGNALSMTLAPQDSSHSKKVKKILVENDGVVPEMQTCHSPNPWNLNYLLVVTELQLPWPWTWPTCQTKGTYCEGEHMQCICAIVVAANALHWQYDHQPAANKHDNLSCLRLTN